MYIYIYIYTYIYTHTHLWPMHIIWQKLTQHCKAIILQLKIKNTYKRKNKKRKKKPLLDPRSSEFIPVYGFFNVHDILGWY